MDRARQIIDKIFLEERDESHLLEDDLNDAARFLLRTMSRIIDDDKHSAQIPSHPTRTHQAGFITIRPTASDAASRCAPGTGDSADDATDAGPDAAARRHIAAAARRQEERFGTGAQQAYDVLTRLGGAAAALPEEERARWAAAAAAAFPLQVLPAPVRCARTPRGFPRAADAARGRATGRGLRLP